MARPETLVVFDDVHIFDPVTSSWTSPEVDTSRSPPGLSRHTAVYFPERHSVILFGGYRKTTRRVNEVFELNLDTMQWSTPVIDGEPPSPR